MNGLVYDRNASGREHLMRNERYVRQRQAQSGVASIIDVVEIVGRDSSVINKAKREVAHLLTIEMNLDFRVPGGEHLDRHQPEFEAATRGFRPRIKNHAIPSRVL